MDQFYRDIFSPNFRKKLLNFAPTPKKKNENDKSARTKKINKKSSSKLIRSMNQKLTIVNFTKPVQKVPYEPIVTTYHPVNPRIRPGYIIPKPKVKTNETKVKDFDKVKELSKKFVRRVVVVDSLPNLKSAKSAKQKPPKRPRTAPTTTETKVKVVKGAKAKKLANSGICIEGLPETVSFVCENRFIKDMNPQLLPTVFSTSHDDEVVQEIENFMSNLPRRQVNLSDQVIPEEPADFTEEPEETKKTERSNFTLSDFERQVIDSLCNSQIEGAQRDKSLQESVDVQDLLMELFVDDRGNREELREKHKALRRGFFTLTQDESVYETCETKREVSEEDATMSGISTLENQDTLLSDSVMPEIEEDLRELDKAMGRIERLRSEVEWEGEEVKEGSTVPVNSLIDISKDVEDRGEEMGAKEETISAIVSTVFPERNNQIVLEVYCEPEESSPPETKVTKTVILMKTADFSCESFLNNEDIYTTVSSPSRIESF